MLGDGACGIDLDASVHRVQADVVESENNRIFRFNDLAGFAAGWFDRGILKIQSGAAQGLSAAIKVDRAVGDLREISLWEPLRADVQTGDQVSLTVGCDKRLETKAFPIYRKKNG